MRSLPEMMPVPQPAGALRSDIAALSSSEFVIVIFVDYFLNPTFLAQLWALRPAYLTKTIPVETMYGPVNELVCHYIFKRFTAV